MTLMNAKYSETRIHEKQDCYTEPDGKSASNGLQVKAMTTIRKAPKDNATDMRVITDCIVNSIVTKVTNRECHL